MRHQDWGENLREGPTSLTSLLRTWPRLWLRQGPAPQSKGTAGTHAWNVTGCEDTQVMRRKASSAISTSKSTSQHTFLSDFEGASCICIGLESTNPTRIWRTAGNFLEVTTYRNSPFVRVLGPLIIILLHFSPLLPEDFLWNKHKTSYFRNKMCFSLKLYSGPSSPNKAFPSWSNWFQVINDTVSL